MFTAYVVHEGGLRSEDSTGAVPASAVWIDMLRPSVEEEARVAAALGIELPTREEMQEIEISSRLYSENGALFMTATILAKAESEHPDASPVTFVLSGDKLVTIRYAEPRSFQAFVAKSLRPRSGNVSADAILIGLLETIVDRMADILEHVGVAVDAISREVFEYGTGQGASRDFQVLLQRIGQEGDLDSKVRESLVSIGRLLAFLTQGMEARKPSRETKARIKTMNRDVHSLTDHASFVSSKINFLLDATLGMINIEQNAIIKIFSVAAVVFLPPTLLASIYGMNFDHIPELQWLFGYPLALMLMVASAVIPYWYFKRRGWL